MMMVPIIGPLIVMVFALFASIPFYFIWNHLAPIYFNWLPQAFHNIPFWDCMWFFMLSGLVKFLIYPRFYAPQTNDAFSDFLEGCINDPEEK